MDFKCGIFFEKNQFFLCREKINVYNDTRKDIELWMTKADQQLQCGWDCIDDSNALDSIVKLDRVIDLPDSRKE